MVSLIVVLGGGIGAVGCAHPHIIVIKGVGTKAVKIHFSFALQIYFCSSFRFPTFRTTEMLFFNIFQTHLRNHAKESALIRTIFNHLINRKGSDMQKNRKAKAGIEA